VLLRHVLRLDRATLLARSSETMGSDDRARFAALLDQRAHGVPVAYIVGEREFMGLPFAVGPGVLVPRPETEGLVEWAVSWLAARSPATILDVGTGSGAIALALAVGLPAERRDRIVGSDVSAAALAVATENRARLGLAGRVDLVRGNLAAWCGGDVDLVLANLPYLRPDQLAGNRALAAEPALALLGGDDGLGLIRRLVADAPRLLAAGGALGVEIDPSQADEVCRLVTAALPDAQVTVRHDLAGWPRHVLAERGSGEREKAIPGRE
jgi:release factor glutamine methyltransferase